MIKIIQFIKDWFYLLSGERKRRLAIICAVVFAAVLTLFVLLRMGGNKGDETRIDHERLSVLSPIPADELFLPDEPDYIPEILLDRERRSVWTETDAAEYWQDPLRGGEEKWRGKIEEAIDELLERIP